MFGVGKGFKNEGYKKKGKSEALCEKQRELKLCDRRSFVIEEALL